MIGAREGVCLEQRRECDWSKGGSMIGAREGL